MAEPLRVGDARLLGQPGVNLQEWGEQRVARLQAPVWGFRHFTRNMRGNGRLTFRQSTRPNLWGLWWTPDSEILRPAFMTIEGATYTLVQRRTSPTVTFTKGAWGMQVTAKPRLEAGGPRPTWSVRIQDEVDDQGDHQLNIQTHIHVEPLTLEAAPNVWAGP